MYALMKSEEKKSVNLAKNIRGVNLSADFIF